MQFGSSRFGLSRPSLPRSSLPAAAESTTTKTSIPTRECIYLPIAQRQLHCVESVYSISFLDPTNIPDFSLTMRHAVLLVALSAVGVASAQNFTINPGSVDTSTKSKHCPVDPLTPRTALH
jgi:hypothetical protein